MAEENASVNQESSQETTETKKKSPLKPIIFLLVLGGLIFLATQFDVRAKLKEVTIWIESLGPLGPIVFIGVYVVAAVAFLPGSVLTIAAGALFGSIGGVIYTILGATLGASVAFLVARYFARDTVSGWLSKSDKFRELDKLTEKHGPFIVAITRLVPIFPFNVLNYMFGLTRVPFWTFVLWSFLCMLPGTMLYVVGTDAIFTGLREGRVPWVLIVFVVAVGAIVAGLVRYAKGKLKEEPAEEKGN